MKYPEKVTLVTWDIIKDNLDKPWVWATLSNKCCITWDIVKENLDKPWSWKSLSNNSIITWDIVKNNLDKPWCWKKLSFKIKNPHKGEEEYYFNFSFLF